MSKRAKFVWWAGLTVLALIIILIAYSMRYLPEVQAQTRSSRVALTVTSRQKTVSQQALTTFTVTLRNNTRGVVKPVLELTARADDVLYMPNLETFSPEPSHVYYRVDKPSAWWRVSLKKAGSVLKQSITMPAGARKSFCLIVRARWRNSSGFLLGTPVTYCLPADPAAQE